MGLAAALGFKVGLSVGEGFEGSLTLMVGVVCCTGGACTGNPAKSVSCRSMDTLHV